MTKQPVPRISEELDNLVLDAWIRVSRRTRKEVQAGAARAHGHKCPAASRQVCIGNVGWLRLLIPSQQDYKCRFTALIGVAAVTALAAGLTPLDDIIDVVALSHASNAAYDDDNRELGLVLHLWLCLRLLFM